MNVTEHPCIEHQRGGRCGKTWFQFTAHDHTVGACCVHRSEDPAAKPVPVKGPCTGKVRKDRATGQTVLELLDKHGDVVRALALDPKEA